MAFPAGDQARTAVADLERQLTDALEVGPPPPPPPPPPGAVFAVFMATVADRSTPVNLAGRTVSGKIFVFTGPDTPQIVSVGWWLDNANHTGAPLRTETQAPYDYVGAVTQSQALPFDVDPLANGNHSVTAEVKLADGTSQFVTANFVVAAPVPPPPPPPPGPGPAPGLKMPSLDATKYGAPAGSPTVGPISGGAGTLRNTIVRNTSENIEGNVINGGATLLENVTVGNLGGPRYKVGVRGKVTNAKNVRIVNVLDGHKGESGSTWDGCYIGPALSGFSEGHGDAIQIESTAKGFVFKNGVLNGGGGNACFQCDGPSSGNPSDLLILSSVLIGNGVNAFAHITWRVNGGPVPLGVVFAYDWIIGTRNPNNNNNFVLTRQGICLPPDPATDFIGNLRNYLTSKGWKGATDERIFFVAPRDGNGALLPASYVNSSPG